MDHLRMDGDHLALIMQRIRTFQQQQQQQQPPTLGEGVKRPLGYTTALDQPLDFSAPKKFCPSPEWTHGGYNLSLGSDGHSDRDQSGSISPTGSHRSSASSGKVSPRQPQPGSCSPLQPNQLPRISIPTPSPTSSPACKPDLLTTVPPFALRPLASLQRQEDVKPLAPGFPFLPHSSLPFPFPPALPQYAAPSQHPELARISLDSQQKYADYRENMLRNMDNNPKDKVKAEQDSGSYSPCPPSPTPSSHNMSLPSHSSTPSSGKDSAYWERRRKNNAAAKRSRDARRAKENDIAIRAAFLEQENVELKMKLVQVITELNAHKDARSS